MVDMSISLKVVRSAAVCCASTKRRAMVRRRGLMATASSSRSPDEGVGAFSLAGFLVSCLASCLVASSDVLRAPLVQITLHVLFLDAPAGTAPRNLVSAQVVLVQQPLCGGHDVPLALVLGLRLCLVLVGFLAFILFWRPRLP